MLCKDICPLSCTSHITVERIELSNNFLRRRQLDTGNPRSYTSIKVDNNTQLAIKGLAVSPESPACKDMVELFQYATSPQNRGGTQGRNVTCKYLDGNIWGSGGSYSK